MKLYFGKFSKKYPEQIKELFYASGAEGSAWYGGIQPGDYVFPIFEGKVKGLWRVREYGKKHNLIHKTDDGVVFFDEIRVYDMPVRLSDEFLRCRYFELDLNLVNKSSKSVKKCGFHKITCSEECPTPEAIDFKQNIRKLYISTGKQDEPYFDGDIRVLINDFERSEIESIQIYAKGKFKVYDSLQRLYESKNDIVGRASLKQLLEYAKEDKAKNKEAYISSALQALNESGYFVVTSPIALYDNILVGRKKTGTHNSIDRRADAMEYDENEEPDDEEEITQYEKYADLLEFNPNLILYGPPGTGKTYTAIKIVERFERKMNRGRPKKYNEIIKEGRVKLITFHQSYSYEEFIEGIRPVVDSQAPGDEASQNMSYMIEPGILLQIVNTASVKVLNTDINNEVSKNITESSRIWKVSLGYRSTDDQIYESCKKENEIAIGWLEGMSLEGKSYEQIYSLVEESRGKEEPKPTNDTNSINALVNEMKKGDIALIYDSPRTIRDIAVIDDDKYYYKPNDQANPYPHRRKVVWLKEFDQPYDIYKLNGNKRLTMKTIYELERINFADIFQLTQADTSEVRTPAPSQYAEPYYLIIDEINRGNISKIFGELITLIEKDKRDRISCELPYSRKAFTLPSNIYIIGTMNTADRSIAILDTALRRRFTFVELEPDLNIFDDANIVSTPKVNNTVDLQLLLKQINTKVVQMLDRDHRIGHAYLLNINGLQDLYNIWYYKILPLLMEYFYNDTKSIREIVGSAFINDDGSINYLEEKSVRGQITRFEEALMNIIAG